MLNESAFFTLRKLSSCTDINGGFEIMKEIIEHDKPIKFGVKLYSFNGSDYWSFILNEDGKSLLNKAIPKPNFEIITKEDAWVKIITGKLSPLKALYQGNLRVRGDARLAKEILYQLH